MQKNIPFSYGIHRSPSIGNDGELSECVNLMPKNGEIVNIHPPQDIGITLQDGEKLLYVHNVSGENNYIVLLPNAESGGTLAYYNEKSERQIIEEPDFSEYKNIYSVSSVGNTIIVFSDIGLRYYLFKSGTYKSLGSHVPDLEIVFGLKEVRNSFERGTNITITDDGSENVYITGTGTYEIIGNANNEILNGVFSLLNPFLEKQRESGHFFNPFLVRYAYRTYGGSYMYVSNPVLMIPNSGVFPFIEASNGFEFKTGDFTFTTKDEGYEDNLRRKAYLIGIKNIDAHIFTCALMYKIINQDSLNIIEEWSDIIKSVDIFVTNPSISRLKSEGTCKIYIHGYSSPLQKPSGGYMKMINSTVEGYTSIYGYSGDYDLTNTDYIILPQMEEKEYRDSIVNEGVFRLADSIDIEELKNKKQDEDGFILADVGSLNNINSREQLDTEYDYNSRDKIVSTYGFPYNSRINITGIKRYPYCPKANMMFTFTNGYITERRSVQKTYDVSVYAYLQEFGKTVKVSSIASQIYDMPAWLYFPNSKANKIIFERYDSETQQYSYATISLKQHQSLNGSYYINEKDDSYFEKEQIEFTSERPAILDEEYDDFVLEPNKIYTSEVDNPFVFPLSGINTIGTGDIISICSTTKALSQGQFGQFPLYVFSSDGIWAMEVDADTGLYSSIHPVSRDVCSNSKSIVQIDNAIVFASEQGLKLLQGSDVALISRAMDGYNMDKSIYNILSEYSELFVEDGKTFVDLLRDCSIVYDYPNALLHIYPSKGTKHYIYSFESGEYASFVGHQLESSVPGYPESVLQIGDKLFSYKNKMSDVIQKGYLITRPLSFDDPLAMKMIEDLRIISRRSSGESKVRYAVFASNDNRVWCQLYSLRSRSYKYFRFVVFTDMYDVDTISGMSVQFSYKRTGKMR